jgi:glucose-6-phosphate dehydrogenase assembly protein OpcA
MSSPQIVDNEVWTSESTDVAGIEKALRSLKQAVRTDDDEGVPEEVTETAVANLIVYGVEEAPLEEAADVAAQLSARHPCRLLLFLARPDEPERLSGHVTAFCTFTPGAQRQVCCEQVRITGAGSYAEQMHSVVPSLLLPDIPTFLWWRGAPRFESAMYPAMRKIASRIIVNSLGYRQAFAELAREILQTTYESCAVSDLAWDRLEGWRENIASLFDPPDTRAYLRKIERIEMSVATDVYPTEAVLLLGWLASQLGWEVDEALARENNHWSCRLGKERGQVVCRINKTDIPTSSESLVTLTRISIRAADAILSLTAQPDHDTVCQRTEVGGRVIAEASAGMKNPGLLELLSQEMEQLTADHLYEQAVTVGARLSRG